MTMQSKYYDLFDNMRIPGRWNLRGPVDSQGERIDTWQFKEGRVLDIEGPIRLSMKPAGIALEFSLAMGVPVVHRRVVSLFEHLGLQKVGKYRNVRGLKVDPTKIGDANIFRPWGWLVVLIVSERVKQAMEEEGITGTDFIEV